MAAGDYKGESDKIQFTIGTVAIAKGGVVVVRSGATGMVGIAQEDITASGTGTVAIEGNFEVTKDTTSGAGVFAVGAIVYWDVADAKFSTQASANVKAGICAVAAAAADTTAVIKLIPSKA